MIKLLSNALLDVQTKQGKIPCWRWDSQQPLYLMQFGVLKAITWQSFAHDDGGLVVFLWGGGRIKQIREGNSWARWGEQWQRINSGAFICLVNPQVLIKSIQSQVLPLSWQGWMSGRGQGNESGQATIKCLKLCCYCQVKEPREDKWKWSHFHLPVVSYRALLPLSFCIKGRREISYFNKNFNRRLVFLITNRMLTCSDTHSWWCLMMLIIITSIGWVITLCQALC